MKYQRDIEFIKLIGNRIREIRIKQGISQAQLAYESGIRINQIGRIERGEINTSVTSIYAISKALNVNPCDLIKINI